MRNKIKKGKRKTGKAIIKMKLKHVLNYIELAGENYVIIFSGKLQEFEREIDIRSVPQKYKIQQRNVQQYTMCNVLFSSSRLL